MSLKKMSRIFKFFYYIIFILTLNTFVFQANAYDDEDEEINEKKSLVNLNNNEKLISNIKTKQEACKILNHKVVTYIDLIYYVKNCNLMLINDPEVSNNLIQDQRKSIVSLTANVYAMMPIGNNYTSDDYYNDYTKNSDGSFHSICQKYEKWVVTSDSINYYFIDSCKKRLFKNFNDISLFTDKSKPIFSLQPRILNRFPTGEPIIVKKKSDESVMVVPETEIKAGLPSAKVLCGKLDRKVVSFHEGFFFLENCKLYTISDFNIDIQKKADDLGGIKELTIKQAIGIPQVGTIKSKDVLNRMR